VLVHAGFAADGADRLQQAADEAMRLPASLPPDWNALLPELDQHPDDVVILKRQWGAFYGTSLDLQLRRRGIDRSFFAASPPSLVWRARRATLASMAMRRYLPKMR
jgi:nicotinamidase-related amidase